MSWGLETLGGAPEPALTATTRWQTLWELASGRATSGSVVPALCQQVASWSELVPACSLPGHCPLGCRLTCTVSGGDTSVPRHYFSDSRRWQNTFYPGTARWLWRGGRGQAGPRQMWAQLWGGHNLEHTLNLCEPWPSRVKTGKKNTTSAVRIVDTRGGLSRGGARRLK